MFPGALSALPHAPLVLGVPSGPFLFPEAMWEAYAGEVMPQVPMADHALDVGTGCPCLHCVLQ